MTRVFLFLATNFAIMLLIGVVFQILGLEGILASNGVDLNLSALLVMSAVIGFGGAFISLALSKWSAKRGMGVHIIEQPDSQTEQWLVDTVRKQSNQANIGMPEVGIFQSDSINAFATGMSRNNALVAVSTGLLAGMNADEAEAVLAHEVAHVANGDMLTMGLLQGVVNTFVIFLSRIIGFFVDRVLLKNERGLGAVCVGPVTDFFGNTYEPLFVAIALVRKAALALMVRKVQIAAIGLGDLILAIRLVVIPTDKVDGITKIISIRAPLTCRLLVRGPGLVSRLCVAISTRRATARNHPEYLLSRWPCLRSETRFLVDE